MGKRGQRNERFLRRFLDTSGVTVAFATDATIRAYAQLYRQLRTQGTPIPTNDLWIASLAVEHDAALFTRDKHFRHLPQLDTI